MSKLIDIFKNEVEKKYIKPEPLPATEIREIFEPYAKDIESFQKLSDEQLIFIYEEWYRDNFHIFIKKVSEMEKPDLEEN